MEFGGDVRLLTIGTDRHFQDRPAVVLAAHRVLQRRRIGWIAWMTSAFLERTASASKEIGGSIAVIASSWKTWFGTMSRSAPVFS